MNINDLLSFHRPSWVNGAEQYARHAFQLYNLGLWEGPSYPADWFAGRWERIAQRIILNLLNEHGKVTAEAFSAALNEATEEAQRTYT